MVTWQPLKLMTLTATVGLSGLLVDNTEAQGSYSNRSPQRAIVRRILGSPTPVSVKKPAKKKSYWQKASSKWKKKQYATSRYWTAQRYKSWSKSRYQSSSNKRYYAWSRSRNSTWTRYTSSRTGTRSKNYSRGYTASRGAYYLDRSRFSANLNGYNIVRTALSLQGVPYRFGGTSTRYGLDCSAFVQTVYSRFGLRLPRVASSQFYQGSAISKTQLRHGDLVFFQNTYKRGLSHVGIYIGDGNFVHASSAGRCVKVSSLSNSYFRRHWAGARRLSALAVAYTKEANYYKYDDPPVTSPVEVSEVIRDEDEPVVETPKAKPISSQINIASLPSHSSSFEPLDFMFVTPELFTIPEN